MSRRLVLLLALVLAVGLVVPAYAEVQNVKVSGDIGFEGVGRQYLTLRKQGDGVADFGEEINAVLSHVRVRVDADLTDNVSTTVRLINERVWGEEGTGIATSDGGSGQIDLDLAYVTLKEFLYSPLSITVGRQNLRYGSALVVGDPDTNAAVADYQNNSRRLPRSLADFSLRKSFDAVKAVLNYDPLVIDLIYSRIDENLVNMRDNTALYGANIAYAVNKSLNTELYYFQRTRRNMQGLGNGAVGTPNGFRDEPLRTLGTRVVYAGIKDLSLSGEGAWQFGKHMASTVLYPNDVDTTGNDVTKIRDAEAWAVQVGADYLFSAVKYTPKLNFQYTYLSGERDEAMASTDAYRGWDPMFEDQFGGTLFNKIYANTNLQVVNLGGSVKPLDDVALNLNYYNLRLARAFRKDAKGSTNGYPRTLSGINGDPTYNMRAGEGNLGWEVDLGLTYDYTEDVQFGLTWGRYTPGRALKGDRSGGFFSINADSSDNSRVASQVVGSMKVTF